MFRPRGLYQAKFSMSSNVLLDKGRMAENLQKECFVIYDIFYFPMDEPFQPYSVIADPINRFSHPSWMAVVTQTDRPKSVRNCCVIEHFVGVFAPALRFQFSVGIRDFVIGVSQISSLYISEDMPWQVRYTD